MVDRWTQIDTDGKGGIFLQKATKGNQEEKTGKDVNEDRFLTTNGH
jgi:hypothetical protein